VNIDEMAAPEHFARENPVVGRHDDAIGSADTYRAVNARRRRIGENRYVRSLRKPDDLVSGIGVTGFPTKARDRETLGQ
jgi:hypothetical protein